MPKLSAKAGALKVKVSYRKGNSTATIAIPTILLQAWSNPEYLVFVGENGIVTIKPTNSEIKQPANSEITGLNSCMAKSCSN